MSTYGNPAANPAPGGYGYGGPATATPVRRPKLLTTAMIIAVLAAALTAVASILVIAIGRDMLVDALNEGIGGELLEPDNPVFDEPYNTLVTKAVVAIVPAVLVLLFAVLSRGGAMWARVVLTVVAVIGVVGNIPIMREKDLLTPGVYAFFLLGVVLYLAIPVLAFLPPINKYAKARAGKV